MKKYFSVMILHLIFSWSGSALAADVAPQFLATGNLDLRSDDELKAVAKSEFLMGSWEGTGSASESIYGTLNISQTYIAWYDCKTKYSIVQNSVGDGYPDEFRHTTQDNLKIRYVTLKLKLEPGKCVPHSKGFLQFSIPADTPNEAVVIELKPDNTQIGRMSFSKR